MSKRPTKSLTLAGLFIALGLLMPFLTAQVPSIGSRLLPMHIPVLLAGFVCGWPYGLAVGLIVPMLRSMLFGMPPLFPTAFVMTFELGAYGLLAGWFYNYFPKKSSFTYLALILSMIGGRIVWGIVSLVVYGLNGTPFTWQLFTAGAVVNAIPGIIIQIIIIPIIVLALQRAKLIGDQ